MWSPLAEKKELCRSISLHVPNSSHLVQLQLSQNHLEPPLQFAGPSDLSQTGRRIHNQWPQVLSPRHGTKGASDLGLIHFQTAPRHNKVVPAQTPSFSLGFWPTPPGTTRSGVFFLPAVPNPKIGLYSRHQSRHLHSHVTTHGLVLRSNHATEVPSGRAVEPSQAS